MVKGWAADITPLYDKEIYIKYFEFIISFLDIKCVVLVHSLFCRRLLMFFNILINKRIKLKI